MSWKTTAVLLVVALGIGAFLVFGYSGLKGTDEKEKEAEVLIAEDDLKDITRFELKSPAEDMVCEKRMQGTVEQWTFVKPGRVPAGKFAVSPLIQLIRKMPVDPALPPERKPSDDVTGLKVPQLTLTVATPSKTFVVRFGKLSLPQEDTVWASLEGDPRVYQIPKETFEGINKKFKDLRDRTLATYESWKVDRVIMSKKAFKPGGEEFYEDFELVQKGGGWDFTRPVAEKADDATITQFLSSLNAITIDDFQPKPEKLDEFGLEKPDLKVQIFERGQTEPVTVHFGKRIKDDSSRMTVYNPVHVDLGVIHADQYDRLKKRPDDFRDKVVFTCGEDQVRKIVIKLPWKEVELVREEKEIEKEIDKEGKKEKVKEKIWEWALKKPESASYRKDIADVFLRALLNMRVTDFMEREATNLGQYYLSDPACTLTLVYAKAAGGEVSQTITVGAVPNRARAYMMRSTDATKQVYELPVENLEMLELGDINLLDPTVFSATKDSILSLSVQFDERGPFSRAGRYACEKDPAGTWKWSEATREQMKGLEIDPGRMEVILQRFSRLITTRYVSDRREAVAQNQLDRPEVTVTIKYEKADGGTKTVQEKSLVISPKVGYNTVAKFTDSPLIFSTDPSLADTLKEGVHKRESSGHDDH